MPLLVREEVRDVELDGIVSKCHCCPQSHRVFVHETLLCAGFIWNLLTIIFQGQICFLNCFLRDHQVIYVCLFQNE